MTLDNLIALHEQATHDADLTADALRSVIRLGMRVRIASVPARHSVMLVVTYVTRRERGTQEDPLGLCTHAELCAFMAWADERWEIVGHGSVWRHAPDGSVSRHALTDITPVSIGFRPNEEDYEPTVMVEQESLRVLRNYAYALRNVVEVGSARVT